MVPVVVVVVIVDVVIAGWFDVLLVMGKKPNQPLTQLAYSPHAHTHTHTHIHISPSPSLPPS